MMKSNGSIQNVSFPRRRESISRQQGFSLVATIFILVILAILGSYMSVMSINQNQASAMSVQGIRAWYAAESGLDWVGYYIFDEGGTGNNVCPANGQSIVDSGGSALEGFTVTMTDCDKTTHREAGKDYDIYKVTILAKRGNYGDIDYVQRSLTATLGGS